MTPFRPRIVFAVVVAGSLLAVPAARASTPLAPAAPARVAVVSRTLDVFQTGSQVGPSVINGIVNTVVGSQTFPPPANQIQTSIEHASTQLAGAMSTAGPQGIDQIRRVVAPAACANAAVDAGIQTFANGLDGVVTLLAPAIQPVDRTIHQTAGLVRGFQEPVTTCAP